MRVDRPLLAWEWLRRDPRYVRAAEETLQRGRERREARREHHPGTWGLAAFEAPALAAPRARPFWSHEAYSYVLACEAEDRGDPKEMFDLASMGSLLTRIAAPGGLQLLLFCDGCRYLRLDVKGAGEAQCLLLRYALAGRTSAEQRLLTLRRLLALGRRGDFARDLHQAPARARRLVLQLRVHDALQDCRDQREIASELLSRSAAEPLWRSRASSIRSQVQRLVREARVMASGGYRKLLR